MSTRSNIAIRLRTEDRNRDLETEMGTIVNAKGKPYLYVYCHNDGYPSGVGQDLKDMFDGASYEDALEYILMGDRSTTQLSYWQWRRETNVDPVPADTEEDCDNEEYLYILEERKDGGHSEIRVHQYGTEEWDDDDVREAASDWFDSNEDDFFEEDQDIMDLIDWALDDIFYGSMANVEGYDEDTVRDLIEEVFRIKYAEASKERESEDEEEADEEVKDTKESDEIYQVNSHGDLVGPKQMTVNSHGDIVYTDAPDWR